MALIDINKELSKVTAPAASSSTAPSRREAASFYADEPVERELTGMVLRKLDDPIAEVKNMTVTWSALEWSRSLQQADAAALAPCPAVLAQST